MIAFGQCLAAAGGFESHDVGCVERFFMETHLSQREIASYTGSQHYSFGEFDLDVAACRLTLNDAPVRLERRPFDLLVLLVNRHGYLVSRDEIVSLLWPANVIIDFEAGVNTLIRKIRQALSDRSDSPVYIETVPGRGYRFIAPVAELNADHASVPPDRKQGSPVASLPQQAALPREPKLVQERPAMLLMVTIAVLALAVLIWQISRVSPHPTSIVILPFENLTGNEELGYLAAGLAEETSASLSRIDPVNLQVTGGVSATALAGSSLPIAEIGRKLGVEYVMKSSLQADASQLRVHTSLLRVADNQLLWSATFDRALLNPLGLQRELSIAIAEQIRLSLSPDVAAQIDRRQTQNPEAYRWYLKGRYAWGSFTPSSNRDALQYYQKAVLADQDYSLAWAGIAQALALSPMTTDAQPQQVAADARAALKQALHSGAELAEVMYAKGYVNFFLDWDMRAAEASARQSVQLDPNNAVSHMFLGVVLAEIQNDEEARVMMQRARELDPLFAQTFALSAMVANYASDYASGLAFAKQAIAMAPNAWVGHLHLGHANLALGNLSEALKAYTDAERLSGGNTMAVAYRAFVLARMSQRSEAENLLASLEAKSEQQYVPPGSIAIIYAGLDDTESTLVWLERALSVRDVHMLGIQRELAFKNLHSDPRFQSLLNRRQAFVE